MQCMDSCSGITDCPDVSIDSALIDDVIKDDNTEQQCWDVLTNLLNTVYGNTLLCQKKLTRKRSVNSSSWARNIRKNTNQSKEKHIISRGKLVEVNAKKIKKDCMACW